MGKAQQGPHAEDHRHRHADAGTHTSEPGTLRRPGGGASSCSGSIGSSASQVREAATDFLIALKNTNSTLRINRFSDRATQLAPRSPVNDATTGPGGVLSNGVAAYPKPNGGTN